MNRTLQNFIDKLIEELKYENELRKSSGEHELDIPFIISSLYQSFERDEDRYNQFILDLYYHNYDLIINVSEDEIANVYITLDNEEALHEYELSFYYDERNWGYCECSPDMPDYREDKHCCGHGCDADFCSFTLNKIVRISNDTWHGDEHDYWEFEDEFYKKEEELLEKKIREDKRQEIDKLIDNIEYCIKRLRELGITYK